MKKRKKEQRQVQKTRKEKGRLQKMKGPWYSLEHSCFLADFHYQNYVISSVITSAKTKLQNHQEPLIST